MFLFTVSRRRVLTLAGLSALACVRSGRTQGLPGPAVPIQELYESLLVIMKQGRSTPFTQRADVLGPAIDAALDLSVILQAAVGLGWSAISAPEQAQLQTAFRDYTLATYVANFDTFSGERLEVSRDLRPASNGDQIVQTRIGPASGSGHAIDYVMRQRAGDWRGVDVLLDGSISRVAVLRSDFRRLLANGPSALASDLQHKASDLMSASSPV